MTWVTVEALQETSSRINSRNKNKIGLCVLQSTSLTENDDIANVSETHTQPSENCRHQTRSKSTFSIYLYTFLHVFCSSFHLQTKNLFCTIYFGISHIRTELFLSKKRETLIFVLTTTYTHTLEWVVIVVGYTETQNSNQR